MARRTLYLPVMIAAALAVLALTLVVAAAAMAQTASVEGESFTHPRGTAVVYDQMYSGGAALKFKKSKALATRQVTISEPSTVLVRARAGQKKGGSPTLTIRVDGENSGTLRITSTALADYNYPAVTLQPGTYTIGLNGGNLAPGRNVFVDVVTFPTGGSPPDTEAPETTIDSGPSGVINEASASFSFSSSESGSTFECSLDGASFVNCTSPQTYSNLADGDHTFQVRATDPAGNVDSSPASRSFTIDTAPRVAASSGLSSSTNGALIDSTPTGSNQKYIVQTFTPTASGNLAFLEFYFAIQGETNTGRLEMQIWEKTPSAPSGKTNLVNSAVLWTTSGVGYQPVSRDIRHLGIHLEAGHEYAIALRRDGEAYPPVSWQFVSGYDGGALYEMSEDWSTSTPLFRDGGDAVFKVSVT